MPALLFAFSYQSQKLRHYLGSSSHFRYPYYLFSYQIFLMHDCPIRWLVLLVVQIDLITFIILFTNKMNTKSVNRLIV